MDNYAFNCLPREERAELVWQCGRFLAIRLTVAADLPLNNTVLHASCYATAGNSEINFLRTGF
jgi:hypothetical protein